MFSAMSNFLKKLIVMAFEHSASSGFKNESSLCSILQIVKAD